MGVKGLQTFLKKNQLTLGKKVRLQDTHLVIDANNLLCHLYTWFTTDYQSEHFRNDIYGGDLVTYGLVVRQFFKSLKECNITPVLVFDGSVIGKHSLRQFVASKEEETKRRGQDRFDRAKTMDEFADDDNLLLPQNLNIVFRSVVFDMNLRRIQTPYEADTHIARIANELDCPVLTNDSDFLIYNLKNGFILLDTIDWSKFRIDSNDKSYIEGVLFTQEGLRRRLRGFNSETLPLLSVLLGNDYVEAGKFDRVLKSICNGPYHGQFRADTFSHRRIANLLSWLEHKTMSESVRYIVNLVHPSNRDKLEKIITILLRNYRIEIEDDFEQELELIYPSKSVSSPKDPTPVEFLMKQMEIDELGSIALDMIFHNTHYNYSIVDDHSLPSSGHIKFRPYSLAIALLRPKSYQSLTTYQRQIMANSEAFLIYDRLDGNYHRFSVKPADDIEPFGSILHLDCYSMLTLDKSMKRSLLSSCFRYTMDERDLLNETLEQLVKGAFLEQATLCFLLIKYIGLETKLPPKSQFVDALLLTIVYHAALDNSLNEKSVPTTDMLGTLFLRLKPLSQMGRTGPSSSERDPRLFRRIVHFINQLYAAFKGYALVNSLLDYPYCRPRLELYLNSVLVYRITRLLRLGKETVLSLCPDLPLVPDVCESIETQVNCG